jgi:hypothetical protein
VTRTPLTLLALIAGTLPACQAANHAPALDPIPPATVVVGEELVLVLNARDPDGDALAFSAPGAPSGSHLQAQGQVATFTWAPLITDTEPGGRIHTLSFKVSDGNGGSDTATAKVTVMAEGGAPELQNPAGYVLNLAEQSHIAFVVRVKDDDSVEVAIELTRTIEGAQLLPIDGKSRSFYWKPTAAQIAESSTWWITVRIDDGVHPAVERDIGILLVGTQEADCTGSPPTIGHVPLADQPQGEPVALTADVSDAETSISSVVAHWRVGDSGPYEAVAMGPADGGAFTASLSGLLGGEDAALVRYYLEARDDDDLTGTSCDRTARFPKAGELAFAVYDPAAPVACLDDDLEPNDSPEQAVATPPGSHGPLRACGDSDWYRIDLEPSDVVIAVAEHAHGALELALYSSAGDVLAAGTGSSLAFGPVAEATSVLLRAQASGSEGLSYTLDLHTSAGVCPADALEPNDTPGGAKALPSGTFAGLGICPGDVDWHGVELEAGQRVRVSAIFDQGAGDLDAAIVASDGLTALAVGTSTTSDEHLEFVVAEAGIYFVLVVGFAGAANHYDLVVTIEQPGEYCTDDVLAPSASTAQAAVLPAAAWGGLTLCPGTSDWFAYGLNGGETLAAEVVAETAGAALAVEIVAPDGGTSLGEAGPPGASAWSEATVTEPGVYFIRVSSESEAPSDYVFALAASDPPGPCVEDRFEPNDRESEATPVPQHGILTRGKSCGPNPDFFRTWVGGFDTLVVWTLFDATAGDLEVQVTAPDGSALGVAAEVGPGEKIAEWLAPEPGFYDIRVAGPANGNIAYDLVVFSGP